MMAEDGSSNAASPSRTPRGRHRKVPINLGRPQKNADTTGNCPRGIVLTLPMEKYPATPSADSHFTPAQLIAAIRTSAGGRAPIGVRPVRAAIAAGELPAALIGNRHVIRWSDFLAWLDSHRLEPAQRTEPEAPADRRDTVSA